MAARNNQPLHGGFATIIALTLVSAAPVLAAPDRSICEDAAPTTLDFTTAEFSASPANGEHESTEFLAPNLELASREKANVEDDEKEQTERTVEDDADADQSDAAAADTVPLVHRRQMYRRDI